MPYHNYIELLNNVLEGKKEAIVEWSRLAIGKKLNAEEISQAKHRIKLLMNEPSKKAHALNLSGFLYRHGIGEDQNLEKAIELFEQAIELENDLAMYNRALMHQQGIGGNKNPIKAIELYEKAIALGNDLAMNNRAVMHANGIGIIRGKTEKAIELFEMAIALGNSNAMNNLAHLYCAAKNFEKAIELYEKAMELGDVSAMAYRAHMHEYGEGGDKNLEKAIELYEKAIELGDSPVMAMATQSLKKLNSQISVSAENSDKEKSKKLKKAEHNVGQIQEELSPIASFTSTKVQNKEPSNVLCKIVDTLIQNISNKENNRMTSGSNSAKVSSLEKIKGVLKGEINLRVGTPEHTQYLVDIMMICQQRRNVLHFWQIPHSVHEYQDLLKKHNIDFPTEQEHKGPQNN